MEGSEDTHREKTEGGTRERKHLTSEEECAVPKRGGQQCRVLQRYPGCRIRRVVVTQVRKLLRWKQKTDYEGLKSQHVERQRKE